MTMAIAAFPDGGPIPPKYTQAGEQVSPAIAWMNAPANTQSFVLHFHDAEVARNLDHRGPAALDRLEHSRHRHRVA